MYLLARNKQLEYYHIEKNDVFTMGKNLLFMTNPELSVNIKSFLWVSPSILKIERSYVTE